MQEFHAKTHKKLLLKLSIIKDNSFCGRVSVKSSGFKHTVIKSGQVQLSKTFHYKTTHKKTSRIRRLDGFEGVQLASKLRGVFFLTKYG